MNRKFPASSVTCWALIPAAGSGSRMHSSLPKQYMRLNGQSLIEHSVLKILDIQWIKGIVIAIAEDDQHWNNLSLSNHPRIETVIGGAKRVDSVTNALNLIQDRMQKDDFIMVHDAARPCIDKTDLEKLYQALQTTEAGVVLADKITDTVKSDDGDSAVLKTIPRDGLWRALTPQIFPQQLLTRALKKAQHVDSSALTDESSAVELLGLSPLLVQGRSDNIKVTTAGDMQLASLILKKSENRCE